ncbi:hypothetical protein [Thetidibacter halocola]|uniref:DUF7742 domain-containing protein n=1 Tax=Thetidibacter halocola TaxID=2827239 RepID=A0A8J7WFL4_9RHOB|nr:hypothetical protein [Thetidibacter halocola]MBS0124254.1 hypothetical protein [Thetidibacter halocola]
MRPVLHGDVIAAARAILPLPPLAREAAARRLVAQAEAADRYRKRMGRVHRDWGNGTLMGAAGPGVAAVRLGDPEMLDAMRAVIDALLERAVRAGRHHG